MELKIKDVAELLQVPEKTVLDWIQSRKLPALRINNQYRFTRAEVNEWILTNNVRISNRVLELSEASQSVSLVRKLERGGVFYDIPGDTVESVLRNAAASLPLPDGITQELIVSILLEREEMMPTAMGNGIAMPHPRTPIIADDAESLSICFTRQAIDYHSLDQVPVHTLFIILSANQRRHLQILSRLAFLCQKTEFVELLRGRAPRDELVAYISRMEAEIDRN